MPSLPCMYTKALKGQGKLMVEGQLKQTTTYSKGSFRVRSTNGLRVTPPISMKFGTLADNA